jgi:Circularly permutated YpsA SLOG family
MPKGAGKAPAEAALRRQVRGVGLTVVTGGQTGVDTGAARSALTAGLPVHVIFPAGFRQEDGNLTERRRAELRGAELHELASTAFRYRTWTCVYVSDAAILLDPAGGRGCQETVRAARRLGRPLLAPETGSLTAEETEDWLASTGAGVLLIAGCRGSLIARRHADRGLRAQLDAITAGARRYHDAQNCRLGSERAGQATSPPDGDGPSALA